MRINFQKIKDYFKKLPWLLGEHAFFTFLSFVFIAVIIGGFMFYKYSIAVKKRTPEVKKAPIYFNEELYKENIKIWEEREEKFKKTDFKVYLNPFLESSLTQEKEKHSETSLENE